MSMREEHRLQTIGSAILDQAEKQSRAIIDQINNQRTKELEEFTNLMKQQMENELAKAADKSKKEILSSIALAEQDAYQTLLRRRNELTQQVFDNVSQQLREFAASTDYPKWLAEQLKVYAGGDPSWQKGTVYLRTQDMPLAPELEAVLPGCHVSEDPHIRLGGFILENEAGTLRADYTLENRLNEQRAWFLQHCGLKVQ